eukprot:4255801-Pleurochrysis_carterae.AAC.7
MQGDRVWFGGKTQACFGGKSVGTRGGVRPLVPAGYGSSGSKVNTGKRDVPAGASEGIVVEVLSMHASQH